MGELFHYFQSVNCLLLWAFNFNKNAINRWPLAGKQSGTCNFQQQKAIYPIYIGRWTDEFKSLKCELCTKGLFCCCWTLDGHVWIECPLLNAVCRFVDIYLDNLAKGLKKNRWNGLNLIFGGKFFKKTSDQLRKWKIINKMQDSQ